MVLFLISKVGLLRASYLGKAAPYWYAQKNFKKESLLDRGSFFSSSRVIQ